MSMILIRENLMLSTNARGMAKYEHYRYKKGSPEAVQGGDEDLNEVEVSFSSFKQG